RSQMSSDLGLGYYRGEAEARRRSVQITNAMATPSAESSTMKSTCANASITAKNSVSLITSFLIKLSYRHFSNRCLIVYMKALVKDKPLDSMDWPTGLRLENRQIPGNLAPDEVLVKVLAAGICGTDVGIYHSKKSIRDEMRRAR